MSNDKGTPARPLLGVIGPAFPFRGLLSSVSGLFSRSAVGGLRSSSSRARTTNTDTILWAKGQWFSSY